MNQRNQSSIWRVCRNQRGQVLVMMAGIMLAILALCGMGIDVGRVYFSYRELQSSTDAAALAGAQSLPSSSAATVASTYSGVAGGKNAHGSLPNVTMVSGSPTVGCASSMTIPLPVCAPASGVYNAIQVKQQVSVPTYFMALFGTRTVPLTATATAVMRGAANVPYNVNILVDTTASMNSSDPDSACSSSRITCALQGVQVFLSELSPCASSESTCGAASGGNVANAVDRVSLSTFPSVSTATVANDYTCGGSPAIQPYTFSGTSSTGYLPPSTITYQIVNFSSDYRSSDTTTSLNTSSDLVKAVGSSTSKTGCMQAIGGVSTFYAQSIYAAQATLVAEQAANPGTQNVLIILSDGDANATNTKSKNDLVAVSPVTLSTTGVYPSLIDQCHQAITAANYAAKNGTTVYTVAYGSAASGCATDSPAITPCQTMGQMASSSATFFSDATTTGTSCPAAQPYTNLNQIFTVIAGDLTVSRLVPDSCFSPGAPSGTSCPL